MSVLGGGLGCVIVFLVQQKHLEVVVGDEKGAGKYEEYKAGCCKRVWVEVYSNYREPQPAIDWPTEAVAQSCPSESLTGFIAVSAVFRLIAIPYKCRKRYHVENHQAEFRKIGQEIVKRPKKHKKTSRLSELEKNKYYLIIAQKLQKIKSPRKGECVLHDFLELGGEEALVEAFGFTV